jgi:hypothetical protein
LIKNVLPSSENVFFFTSGCVIYRRELPESLFPDVTGVTALEDLSTSVSDYLQDLDLWMLVGALTTAFFTTPVLVDGSAMIIEKYCHA